MDWKYEYREEKRFNSRTGEPEKSTAWHTVIDADSGQIITQLLDLSFSDEKPRDLVAKLISAAPDLLRLVKAFESYLSSDKFEDGLPPGAPLIDDVIAVIAKAEGKQ